MWYGLDPSPFRARSASIAKHHAKHHAKPRGGQGQQRAEVSAGRGAPDAQAFGGQAEPRPVGAQPAHRGLDVVQLGLGNVAGGKLTAPFS